MKLDLKQVLAYDNWAAKMSMGRINPHLLGHFGVVGRNEMGEHEGFNACGLRCAARIFGRSLVSKNACFQAGRVGYSMYLPAGTVKALATEVLERSGVAHWISDITTSAFSKALAGGQEKDHLGHVQAPDALTGEQILDALRTHGWTTAEMRSYIRDTGFIQERVRRMFGDRPAAPPPFAQDDPTGVRRFARG